MNTPDGPSRGIENPPKARPGRLESPLKPELEVLIAAVVCTVIAWSLEYARGRLAGSTVVIFSSAVTFIGYPLALVFLTLLPYVFGLVVLIRGIVIHRKHARRLLSSIGLALLIFAIPPLSRLIAPEGAFVIGYADWVTPQLDAPALQQWAIRTIDAAPEDQVTLVTEKPVGIGSLPYRLVDVFPNPDVSQSYVRLLDGGHFIGYYGLMIGSQSLRCTKDQHQIAPGICAWYGPDE